MRNSPFNCIGGLCSKNGNLSCVPAARTPNSHFSDAQTVVLTWHRRGAYNAAGDGPPMAKRHLNQAGNLQSMFLRLEELVLANSGEDEFEEVFKLLIAKLWDERSGSGLFHAHADDAETTKTIAHLLRQAEKRWPGVLEDPVSRLAPQHLNVCVEALERHVVGDEGFEVLDGFFEFLVARAAKGAKGQYFTPRHVVELCVQMLKPKPDETVLDPACGSGGFLIHALNYARRQLTDEELKDYCGTKLWGFDIDSRATRVAKTLMLLAGDGSANIVRLNSLLQPSMSGLFGQEELSLTIEDVCRSRMRKHKGFDVILTNPPFAGEVREKHLLERYAVASKKPRVERDILFVERCIQLLRPGGRMAIVLPHNKFAAESFAHVREWVLRRARVLAVVALGRNTFLPHTHQKASILFVKKNDDDRAAATDYNIFFSISEREGKNSKGQILERGCENRTASLWERVDHDLGEVKDGFEEFCAHEGLEV
jgi:type I restriction enzyme M protein